MSRSSWSSTILSEPDLDFSATCSKSHNHFKKKNDVIDAENGFKWKNLITFLSSQVIEIETWGVLSLTWCIDFIMRRWGCANSSCPISPLVQRGVILVASQHWQLVGIICRDFPFQPYYCITVYLTFFARGHSWGHSKIFKMLNIIQHWVAYAISFSTMPTKFQVKSWSLSWGF